MMVLKKPKSERSKESKKSKKSTYEEIKIEVKPTMEYEPSKTMAKFDRKRTRSETGFASMTNSR